MHGRFALDVVERRSETEIQQTHSLTVEREGQDSTALVAKWLVGCPCFPNPSSDRYCDKFVTVAPS